MHAGVPGTGRAAPAVANVAEHVETLYQMHLSRSWRRNTAPDARTDPVSTPGTAGPRQ